MDFAQRTTSQGFGGPTIDDDAPYGPRTLGATTDGLAAPSLGGVASPGGPITWSVQRLIDETLAAQGAAAPDVHGAAAHGTRGAGEPLPHLDAIQRSFGRHDVRGIEAHSDGAAREGAAAMGAQAFAAGNHVAFADAPSLHTAAHEAAHVVQQRGGVQLLGGVGAAGDVHERHADEVADRVVAGQSAEDLLDQHAPAGGQPAAASGGVQKLIATTPNQLNQVLINQDPAQAQITTVGQNITAYNLICNNNGLAQEVKLQQQIDQLRVLDRSVHAAMTAISNNQVDLRHDPRAQLLHQVLQESEADHRQLVDTVVGDQNLRNQVDCFDAQNTTNQNNDIGQAQARQLWNNIMDNQGKIQIRGAQAYQSQVRSWLTKLMDTRHGRRMLQYLDTGDPTHLQSNVYIAESMAQLPQQVRLAPNVSPDLKDPDESIAQPLTNANTKTSVSNQPMNGVPQVNNPGQYVESVLGGSNGVRMNGQDYRFNQGSGSMVSIVGAGELSVATGQDRNNNQGGVDTPEIYQPDWVVLGHELGHSVNMRAGATTNGTLGLANPTDVFAQHMTGNNNQQSRQGRWYGGSEEYLNINGNENQIRQEAGLDQRHGHTAAVSFEIERRLPALTNAFNEGAWVGLYEMTSPDEIAHYNNYRDVDKKAIADRFKDDPSNPQHVLDAQNLCQQMVAWYTNRTQLRQAATNVVNNTLNGHAARNALDGNRPYEATLQAQYDVVVQAITAQLRTDPISPHLLTKAVRIVTFCQRWLALRQAHDAAGNFKQFGLKAWWEKAKSANHSVGTAIAADDNAKYVRKLHRITSLRNDYL